MSDLSKPKLYKPRPPNARCCTKRWPRVARPGLNWRSRVSSKARATTTPPSLMSAKLFASTSNKASLPTVLPGPDATTADTTTLWPIHAKTGVSAPRATPRAWWRLRHTFHRFGSSLNWHVNFHVCAVDGYLRKWRARATLMPSPHHRASFFTRPVLLMGTGTGRFAPPYLSRLRWPGLTGELWRQRHACIAQHRLLGGCLCAF